jgi:hypothetical protein
LQHFCSQPQLFFSQQLLFWQPQPKAAVTRIPLLTPANGAAKALVPSMRASAAEASTVIVNFFMSDSNRFLHYGATPAFPE